MIDFKKQGKKNRQSGKNFELRVRKDLEKKKWFIDKWTNNVDLENKKLVPCKPKFNPFTRSLMMNSGGFPDFIVFKRDGYNEFTFTVEAVECKVNGELSKEEKLRCQWLIENKIFNTILIASKGEKRGEITYKEVSHGKSNNA